MRKPVKALVLATIMAPRLGGVGGLRIVRQFRGYVEWVCCEQVLDSGWSPVV